MIPVSFSAIPGQEKAKDLLVKAVQRTKVSHAYLFKGPGGVGKKSIAFAFAAYLNCEGGHELEACGSCGSCKKIATGNHPDVLVIEPEGAMIKIDQIRQLRKKLTFPPFEAEFRVVFLQDIHDTMRRKEVANSLLKTLEEPPPNTIFILTANDSTSVLPTILSRCQVVPFFSLPYETVRGVLVESGVPPEKAETLALISEGSIGKATMLAEKNFLDLRREIVENLVDLQATESRAVEIIFALSEKSAALKNDLVDFLEFMKLWLRDLSILAANGAEKHVLNHDLKHTYIRAGKRWNISELDGKMRLITQAQKEILHNCNKNLVCEVLYWGLITNEHNEDK